MRPIKCSADNLSSKIKVLHMSEWWRVSDDLHSECEGKVLRGEKRVNVIHWNRLINDARKHQSPTKGSLQRKLK